MSHILPILYNQNIFWEDLLHHIKKAKKTIWISTMIYEYGEKANILTDELLKKADTGVDVRLFIDWVTNRYTNGEINFFPLLNKNKREEYARIHNLSNVLFKKISSSKINLTFLNKPNLLTYFFPIIGRNHMKIYSVDDVNWIGGVNIMDGAWTASDFMVKLPKTHIFKSVFTKLEKNSLKKNQEIFFSKHETLYIDAGIKGNSIIYSHMISLIKNAKKNITFMSMFTPDSHIIDLFIQKAYMGISITIITSPDNDDFFTKFPYKKSYDSFKDKVKNINSIHLIHRKHKVHAKLIIVDQELMIGSHNLTSLGVNLGTKEIAFSSSEKNLVDMAIKQTTDTDTY